MACSTNELDSSIFQDEDIESYAACPQSNVKIVKVVPLPHARSEVWSYFGFIADDDGEINDKKKTICKICATTLCYSGNTTNLFTHLKAMHPDVKPQKLAPTNKAPRTGKKSSKRKFYEDSESSLIPIEIDSNYMVRNIHFNSSTPETIDQQLCISNGTNVNNSNTVTRSVINTSSSNNQTNNNLIKIANNKENNTTFTLINSDHHQNNLDLNHSNAIQSDDITDAIVNLIVRDCRPIDLVTGKYFEELLRLLAPNYKIPPIDKLEQLVKKKYIEVRRDLILKSMDDE